MVYEDALMQFSCFIYASFNFLCHVSSKTIYLKEFSYIFDNVMIKVGLIDGMY